MPGGGEGQGHAAQRPLALSLPVAPEGRAVGPGETEAGTVTIPFAEGLPRIGLARSAGASPGLTRPAAPTSTR
jgi:hypothetical protein